MERATVTVPPVALTPAPPLPVMVVPVTVTAPVAVAEPVAVADPVPASAAEALAPPPARSRSHSPHGSGARETVGELAIDSQRPATVLLEGVSLGRTPIRGYALSPGRYELEVVDVATGERQRQPLVMTRGRVHLRL